MQLLSPSFLTPGRVMQRASIRNEAKTCEIPVHVPKVQSELAGITNTAITIYINKADCLRGRRGSLCRSSNYEKFLSIIAATVHPKLPDSVPRCHSDGVNVKSLDVGNDFISLH